MTIATRAAAARPEETAGLLIDLWNADQTGTVCPQWDLFRGQDVSVAVGREQEWGELLALLEAGAFLDAAMMLDDSGFDLRRTMDGIGNVDLYPKGFTREAIVAHAATPALALITAIAASRGV